MRAEWSGSGVQWIGGASTGGSSTATTALSCTRKTNGAATRLRTRTMERTTKPVVVVHYRPLNNFHFHCTARGAGVGKWGVAGGERHSKADYEKLSLFAYVNRIS